MNVEMHFCLKFGIVQVGVRFILSHLREEFLQLVFFLPARRLLISRSKHNVVFALFYVSFGLIIILIIIITIITIIIIIIIKIINNNHNNNNNNNNNK